MLQARQTAEERATVSIATEAATTTYTRHVACLYKQRHATNSQNTLHRQGAHSRRRRRLLTPRRWATRREAFCSRYILIGHMECAGSSHRIPSRAWRHEIGRAHV